MSPGPWAPGEEWNEEGEELAFVAQVALTRKVKGQGEENTDVSHPPVLLCGSRQQKWLET